MTSVDRSLEVWYFFVKSVEVGIFLGYFSEDSDTVNTSGNGIGPFFTHHISLAEDWNIYLGIGIAYEEYETELDFAPSFDSDCI